MSQLNTFAKPFNSTWALQKLYVAQFLSAFVDNMIFFITSAIISKDAFPDYYLSLVQAMFLVSYVVLTPWVGRFADRKAKSNVLIIGNIVKAIGITALITGLDPALSYAIVGIGAVIYSPAKYGILPLLTTNEKQLLRANSSLESYTILAILGGSVAGGYLADWNIQYAMYICVGLYALSVVVNLFIPKDSGNPSITFKNSVGELFTDVKTLLANRQSHFSLVGTGAFWMASIVLRLMMIAWLPLVFNITKEADKSQIIALTGIGIVIGALITPLFISIKTYRRTIGFGFALGLCIISFVFIHDLWIAKALMILVGVFGGIFIVPMNATLQDVGHHSIGAGKTIAIQNFVENIFNVLGVGAFLLAQSLFVPLQTSMVTAGAVLIVLVGYLYLYSRKETI